MFAQPIALLQFRFRMDIIILRDYCALLGTGFDRFHVFVRQAEMMADFVNQHVGDNFAQCILMLRPIIEDWPSIQPDHIGQLLGRYLRLEWQANTLEWSAPTPPV